MAIFEHRARTLRETLSISFPLMLTSLSIYLIYVIDRFVLTFYSLDALNAAVQASTLTWAFWGGITVIAGLSEVFVAQYQIDRRLELGRATWNAIWISLAASVILIPVALLAAKRIYNPGSTEYEYFFLAMPFGVFQPLSYALTSFFVGRGRLRLILLLTAATTVGNAALDYTLVFGIFPCFPPLGAKGGALAGGISMFLQSAVLFLLFLKKNNRITCGTGEWRPRLNVLIKSIRIAAPLVILYNLELWGWSLFYTMMAGSSHIHITISSLCQGLIFLFTFISEGLYRGTLLQINSCLAQGREKQLLKIFASASIILGAFLVVQLAVLAISPKLYLISVSPLTDELLSLLPTFKTCTRLVLLYLLFQGIQWLLWGFLCAIGQTMSMLIAGSAGLFICLVLPTYLLIQCYNYSVEWAWGIVVFYSAACCLIYGFIMSRYRKKQSAGRSIIEDPTPQIQLADKVG